MYSKKNLDNKINITDLKTTNENTAKKLSVFPEYIIAQIKLKQLKAEFDQAMFYRNNLLEQISHCKNTEECYNVVDIIFQQVLNYFQSEIEKQSESMSIINTLKKNK